MSPDAVPTVAQADLPCSRLSAVSACCVLSGARSGVSAPSFAVLSDASWCRGEGRRVEGARLARRRGLPTTARRKRPRLHKSLISTPEVWSTITPISYAGIRITCRMAARSYHRPGGGHSGCPPLSPPERSDEDVAALAVLERRLLDRNQVRIVEVEEPSPEPPISYEPLAPAERCQLQLLSLFAGHFPPQSACILARLALVLGAGDG